MGKNFDAASAVVKRMSHLSTQRARRRVPPLVPSSLVHVVKAVCSQGWAVYALREDIRIGNADTGGQQKEAGAAAKVRDGKLNTKHNWHAVRGAREKHRVGGLLKPEKGMPSGMRCSCIHIFFFLSL